MIRWAVTGPIGAGKSTVTRLLANKGAAVVDGDELGHRVLADPDVVAAVARDFGVECVADGRVDRTRLGGIVFGDPEAMARLNALTHPRLAALADAELERLAAQGAHALAVLEAAVYFLLPTPPAVDLVITVDADPAVRARRLAERTGLDPAEAARRVAAQADMEQAWRERADIVLRNDGDDLARLAALVDELWNRRAGVSRRQRDHRGPEHWKSE